MLFSDKFFLNFFKGVSAMSAVCRNDEEHDFFPTGFHVYYFNKWAGFETEELHQFFERLTHEELFLLKRGDIVWVDQEPYHREGKVYGYTKRVVWGTEMLHDKRFRVSVGPFEFTTFSLDRMGKSIMRVTDEEALKNMLEKLGRFSYQLR